MENMLLDALGVFLGVAAATLVALGLGFLWARRRFRTLRARMIMRVANGELSFGNVLAAIRVNRRGITTGMVRRRLRVDVDGALAAVSAAERSGAIIGDLGAMAADLDVAASSLDAAMASMGPSGATPVILARAGELGISAHQLRRKAEHLVTHAAVPGHAELVDAIGAAGPSVEASRSTRGKWNLLVR